MGTPILLVAACLAALLGAILPTSLYLFVEPRGRRQWAVEGDSPDKRRAPAIIRMTAWLSFALGQTALPWLIVPGTCAVLVYTQLKLGHIRPTGLAITVALGVAALAQAVMALRLFPLGIKLLVRDDRVCSALARRTRAMAFASAVILGGAALLGWAMFTIPNFIHPWLRVALVWGALRPIMMYAAVCLAHAALLGSCCSAMNRDRKNGSA
jgi:hypothetical protein